MPKVSFILSVYDENNEYFKSCLESLFSQTLKDFEIILVDDGMNAENLRTIELFSSDKLIVLTNEINLGLTKSLNKAIKIARGQYIARIDSDDLCHPDRLKVQTSFLNKNFEYVLCGAQEVFQNEEPLKQPKLKIDDRKLKKALTHFNPFIHSSLLVRRKNLVDLGGYNENYRYAQDYDLILRLASIGKIAILENPLIIRNTSINNISIQKNKQQRFYALKSMIRANFRYGPSFLSIWTMFKFIIVIMIPFNLKEMTEKRKKHKFYPSED